MAETETYLSRIKENPSPLLNVVNTVRDIFEQNADQVGCIVGDNAFYSGMITSLSSFTSYAENYTLQATLTQERDYNKSKYEIVLFNPTDTSGNTLYRLDMRIGVESEVQDLVHVCEQMPEMATFSEDMMKRYDVFDGNTLVHLSDNWAQSQLYREEVEAILANARNFHIPSDIDTQCTYRELENYLSEQSEGGEDNFWAFTTDVPA